MSGTLLRTTWYINNKASHYNTRGEQGRERNPNVASMVYTLQLSFLYASKMTFDLFLDPLFRAVRPPDFVWPAVSTMPARLITYTSQYL